MEVLSNSAYKMYARLSTLPMRLAAKKHPTDLRHVIISLHMAQHLNVVKQSPLFSSSRQIKDMPAQPMETLSRGMVSSKLQMVSSLQAIYKALFKSVHPEVSTLVILTAHIQSTHGQYQILIESSPCSESHAQCR